MATFTEKLVKKAFSTTGIHPPNADVILNKFKLATPLKPASPPEQTTIAAASDKPNWLKAKSLLRAVVKDEADAWLGALEQLIHQLHVQLELVQHELKGAKETLTAKERVKDKQKVLPLYAHDIEWHRGAK